jgi:hypothetical protein
MRDVSHLLGLQASQWKASAEQQLSPEFHAALTVAAREMRKLADYTQGVSLTYELPDLGEFLAETVWNPRYGGPDAPAELPQRGQPESN